MAHIKRKDYTGEIQDLETRCCYGRKQKLNPATGKVHYLEINNKLRLDIKQTNTWKGHQPIKEEKSKIIPKDFTKTNILWDNVQLIPGRSNWSLLPNTCPFFEQSIFPNMDGHTELLTTPTKAVPGILSTDNCGLPVIILYHSYSYFTSVKVWKQLTALSIRRM